MKVSWKYRFKIMKCKALFTYTIKQYTNNFKLTIGFYFSNTRLINQ